jgi:2-pyrone-4,6-dicarboxylate lactonase
LKLKPVCLPPEPTRKPSELVIPENAWDCHAHVIGKPPSYPYAEPNDYTPYPVSPADFIGAFESAGIHYGVLVQVVAHGSDNRYLLKALRQFPEKLTGIAVIDATTTEADLADLKEAGVVGIRQFEGGARGAGLADLERMADRCAEIGWHIQLSVLGHRYPELLPRLRRLRAPLVIDHMGWFSVAETPAGPGFQAVSELLRSTDCWLKLSGAFRLSKQGSPYLDTVPYIKELIAIAPNRTVWGSDWPYVGIAEREKMPQYADLLDLLALATSDQAVIRKIFVDNPRQLYHQSQPASRRCIGN